MTDDTVRVPMDDMLKAAKNMDWQQVVLNGGPPCFHLEEGRFCGRAQRWDGHEDVHTFVSLFDLLSAAPQPSGWIKCSERLPEWNTPVLIVDESTQPKATVREAIYTPISKTGDDPWFCGWQAANGSWPSQTYVKLWQPLPAPKPDAAEGEG